MIPKPGSGKYLYSGLWQETVQFKKIKIKKKNHICSIYIYILMSHKILSKDFRKEKIEYVYNLRKCTDD